MKYNLTKTEEGLFSHPFQVSKLGVFSVLVCNYSTFVWSFVTRRWVFMLWETFAHLTKPAQLLSSAAHTSLTDLN